MRVVVIDDQPTDLKLMGHLLTMSGHAVSERTSSEGVLESIAADVPDVMLVDLNMPGIDGLTLIRQLRADVRTCGIPIVAVTAYPDTYPRSELLAAGCDRCIVKPLDTRTLSLQIEEVAQRRHLP
jgi:CheY-like chemotaxis protein